MMHWALGAAARLCCARAESDDGGGGGRATLAFAEGLIHYVAACVVFVLPSFAVALALGALAYGFGRRRGRGCYCVDCVLVALVACPLFTLCYSLSFVQSAPTIK